jgi:hypothetical protein
MTEFIMTLSGTDLIESLRRDCGFAAEAAIRFLESRTGRTFSEGCHYSVTYMAGQSGANWTQYKGLRIWMEPGDRVVGS